MLEELLSEGYEEIGFCHNDLQYGNIMIDEEARSITLIVSYLTSLYSALLLNLILLQVSHPVINSPECEGQMLLIFFPI